MADDAHVPPENAFLVRVLVAAQRWPWAGSALAAYVSLSVLALPLPLVGSRFDGPPATRAALAVLAASVAAHVVAQAPAWGERIAALVVGNAVALAAVLEELLRGTAAAAVPAVVVTAVGVVWALLVPCRPPRPRGVVFVEVVAVGALAWGAATHASATSPPTVAALLALPVVLGAAVASGASAKALIGWALALGAALGLVHLAVALDRPPEPRRIAETLGGAALMGAIFGTLAAVARVARSFTAVPRDHPSFTDFVDGRPRET